MNVSKDEGKLEKEQTVDMVLLALCYLMFASIGYGIIHFLGF